MNTLAHSGIFWAGLIAGLVLIYFLPTMIGIIRKVESLGLLIFLNVLPTGVGWFAAMAMAFMRAFEVTVSSKSRKLGDRPHIANTYHQLGVTARPPEIVGSGIAVLTLSQLFNGNSQARYPLCRK